jgi:PAS domain S-box-containing protein
MTEVAPSAAVEFLDHGTETGRLIAGFDWSTTPLGPIAGWPPPLKTATGMILRSPAAFVLLWGDEGALIYNDAYAVFAGQRHPALLGQPAVNAWPEVADFNRTVLRMVLHEGQTLSYRNQHLVLQRSGMPEDVWLDLDYSPVVGADGKPLGVLAVVRETTAQVQAEQRRRIAQRSGGVGTFEWFPDTGALEVSDEYRQILGLPAQVEVTGDMLDSVVHPDDRARAALTRSCASDAPPYVEFRRIDAVTGSVRWIARRGEVITRGGESRRSFLGVAYDITERKQIEQAVTRSEARWRSLFEQMHEAFMLGEVVRDDRGHVVDFIFIEANPAFERHTGLPLRDVLNRRVREAIPGIETALIERYGRVVDSGQPDAFEVQVAGLGHRWFEARARRVAPERFSVLFVDVSARRAVEIAIRESEKRFRLLAQAMPNHVWTATPNGNLDWFNDPVYAYSGAAPGTLDGTHWIDLVHPDDLPHAAAAWARAREHADDYETEFRLRRHDGTWRWHIARAVPIRRADGTVERWIGTNTDIQDQKSAEAELAALAATLEQRVTERTEELLKTRDALRQAQKMESIGNLTGGIAHDFNNLLQVISGNLQMLDDDVAGNARAERHVRNAMEGVNRGAKLAAQLLAFGRRQPLAPRVVNIGRFIHNMDDLLRRALGEGVKVRTVVAAGLWNTLVDAGHVENALLNLAINARDAMDGEGELTIEASNATLDAAAARRHGDMAPGDYVLLAVSDTGCGMSPRVVEQVFEPFFTTKPEGRGTGLGLSMVYGFVKQTGGHIKVESALGAGTTIGIYLPRAMGAEEMVAPAIEVPADGGSETILVTEDDDVVRETVVATLRDMGYLVLHARDASSALAIVDSGVPIDLLFTDVVMPGMKGAELASRARERIPALAVLFTSGYAEDSIVHDGRLDAGVQLLSKPYTREALARKLRQVLAQRPPRAPAAA